MKMCEQILLISDRYGAIAGIGRKRVSTIVMNRGSKLDDIAEGGDLSTRTFERAMQWFSDNWPEGQPWPEGISRPSVRIAPALEAAE